MVVDAVRKRITESGALGLPPLLRTHLKAIGLGSERPELFVSTAERRQIRVHDLRGTFVTVGLANGRSESWIADRTGHKSSLMIARYKRMARTFAELQTGDFEPLDAAIPELTPAHSAALTPSHPSSITHGLPTRAPNYAKTMASPAGFEPASPT